MKFKVTMKDPDTVSDSLDEASAESVKQVPGLSVTERQALREIRREEFQSICSRWFEYGEYLTVEIDTDTKTIAVCDK